MPWLASPIGPYAGMGEQQGGRLVADGDWFQAIDALMSDAEARRLLSQRGLRWAAGETIEAHVDVWERTFEDAIAQARSAARGRAGALRSARQQRGADRAAEVAERGQLDVGRAVVDEQVRLHRLGDALRRSGSPKRTPRPPPITTASQSSRFTADAMPGPERLDRLVDQLGRELVARAPARSPRCRS